MDKSEVKRQLTEKVCDIEFTKVNGELRKMKATLLEVLLPQQTDVEEEIQKRKPNSDVLAVWDTEAEGWRSFRWDKLKSIDGNDFVNG